MPTITADVIRECRTFARTWFATHDDDTVVLATECGFIEFTRATVDVLFDEEKGVT